MRAAPILYAALILLITSNGSVAQHALTFDAQLYNALAYRCIGPFRGGRSAAVTGVPGDPMTYYFGATGGGVWKTADGGQIWKNISASFSKTIENLRNEIPNLGHVLIHIEPDK